MTAFFSINLDLMTTVREKLIALRKQATENSGIKLTARRLADEADIPWSTYKGWEDKGKRKRDLRTDEIAKLLPVFVKYGVDPSKVRDLAGMENPSLQRGSASTVVLDDGRSATGLPTKIYATPNKSDPFQRPVIPGLLVIAEVSKMNIPDEVISRNLYRYMTHYLEPMIDQDNPRQPNQKLAYTFDDDWYHGTIDIDGERHNCHIVLVPSEWTVKCNTEVFE